LLIRDTLGNNDWVLSTSTIQALVSQKETERLGHPDGWMDGWMDGWREVEIEVKVGGAEHNIDRC
jgi:hypothetical protein